MQKIKTSDYFLVIYTSGFAIAFLCSVFLFGAPVRAADSQIQVLVGDVCPNIPGNQPVLPSGMQLDQNGDCFTPAPPPPADACPNLPDHQAAIPNGYYRNQAGNCVLQTTPSKDVCPNITGKQTSVPQGMHTAPNGDCFSPQQDRCPNITGTQDPVPAGMERDREGNCFTPPESPGAQPGPTKNDPKAPSGPLENIVPNGFKEILRHTSPTLVRALPYYIIGALGFIAIFLAWQTLAEAVKARSIFIAFKRKKHLADEKDTFITLTTRYLRTTITAMLASLDTLTSLHEVETAAATPLAQATTTLQLNMEGLLSKASPNDTENTPTNASQHGRTRRSLLFWIPVVLTGLAVLTVNVLFGVIGDITLGTTNVLLQLVAFIAVGILFYVSVHSRHVRHFRRLNTQMLSDHETTVETQRDAFIQEASSILSNGLREIDTHRGLLADAPSAQVFTAGYAGLTDILAKLILLGRTQTEAGTTTKFDIHDVITGCLLLRQATLDAKKITVTDTSEKHELVQNRPLLTSVLGSIIDNAIKFSNDGGSLTIGTDTTTHRLEIHIGNEGSVMTQEQLTNLFELAQSSEENDSSDTVIGLTLFLDKIIMDELGGTISAISSPGQGTIFTVTVKA